MSTPSSAAVALPRTSRSALFKRIAWVGIILTALYFYFDNAPRYFTISAENYGDSGRITTGSYCIFWVEASLYYWDRCSFGRHYVTDTYTYTV